MTFVRPFMRSKWGWPICESVHFLGLSLLIGTIAMFDLRLMGLAKRIPIGALHRLVPWGVAGYLLNVITGLCFLSTEPNQYIYNSAFHFKIMFMTMAGLNIAAFYLTMFRRVTPLGPGADAPVPARVIGFVSIFCWTAIIVCGRLLTFYRPYYCPDVVRTGLFATCFR